MKDVTVSVEDGTARVDPLTESAQREVAAKLLEAVDSPADLRTHTYGKRTGFLVPESAAKSAGLINTRRSSSKSD